MPLPRYSTGAIALHWIIAVLLIGQLAGGLWMGTIPEDNRQLIFQVLQIHKSVGITILLLTIVRIFWRLTHKAPPLPDVMAAWEKFVARVVHVAFYVILFALPIFGWAMISSSARKVPTVLFGMIPWPNLPLPANKPLHEFFEEAHEYTAFVAIALIVIHVAGALKHYFSSNRGVLSRMIPIIEPSAKEKKA